MEKKTFPLFFLALLSFTAFLSSALKLPSLSSENTFIIFKFFYIFSLNKKTEENKRRW
jgi:hypothetical protein